eukprot:tig00021579_g22442.t1
MAVNPLELVAERVLGRGGFGCVMLARHRVTGAHYAVKRLSPQSEWDAQAAVKEYEHLRIAHHPNLVQVHNFTCMPDGEILLVMELCRGGDLSKQIFQRLQSRKFMDRVLQKNYFPEATVLNWLAQIVSGLKHLHDRKILHRDIKPENVFFKDAELRAVKLGDLGCSTSLSSTAAHAKTAVGTAGYFPPEMLRGATYDAKCDIWALGVMMYEVCRLKLPWAKEVKEIRELKGDEGAARRRQKWLAYRDRIVEGRQKHIPSCYSRELRDLVDCMLALNPLARPTANQILAHPLLAPVVAALYPPELLEAEFSHTVLHADGRRRGVEPVLRLARGKAQAQALCRRAAEAAAAFHAPSPVPAPEAAPPEGPAPAERRWAWAPGGPLAPSPQPVAAS